MLSSQYGTSGDFKTFLREAHSRGLRVITELVLNHTSDQNEWFKKSRAAKPGSTWRDFYVWNDSPDKYQEARIIFTDFENSNWAWDPVAKQYYWHRFYSHQPDLNFDNPNVVKALMRVVDYWFEMGVDGMRLDAVPYLYEREGTNCENLPETYQFLEKLRAHIEKKFKNRMLLAEANQWPEDAVAYFGKGNRCHMAFHFPLMPRLFMGARMEDRFPITDIFEQTPPIPANCQWALFLRNHDELTLEMVSDEERDYMYQMYAKDPSARINLGIRRRLAPLLGNNRRKIELMKILLFSLPGTPVLYYGDEIGMGDNHYLGDRNEVRAFLISSALFWLEKYHADGLRVDAVASMLYRDYSRKEGEWIPNEFGGRENIEAIDFLKKFNEAVYREHPDVQTIAEESTAWPMVSRPAYVGGLGFGMKWNMGWMHDTLKYFSQDPVHRKYHHNQLTFSIWYAFSENFMLSLSHDEVVHGKGSLLGKMPGDDWQKFANLRALFGYMYGHPGKKLFFMGGELGQWGEWNHDGSLDWHLLKFPPHQGLQKWMKDLNYFYKTAPALHEIDFSAEGFEWVDANDWEKSVVSFLRKSKKTKDVVLVACNFTPVPRHNYRVGVPVSGFWQEALNSDAKHYGGSGQGNMGGMEAAPIPSHGKFHSLSLTLPPLSVLFLKATRDAASTKE